MGECQLGETIDSIGESMVKPAVTVAYNWPFIVQRCGGNKSLLMCISCAVVGSHIVLVFVEPLLGSEISQVCVQPSLGCGAHQHPIIHTKHGLSLTHTCDITISPDHCIT